MWRKIISLILVFSLFSIQSGLAEVAQLNLSGYLQAMPKPKPQELFQSPVLRYFSYNALEDNYQLLLDPGSLKDKLSEEEVKGLAKEQLDFFLVGLSLPNSKFWVNLRPDAPDNIIEPELEQTEVGRIMLESDLQLKKDTANFTSPQTKEGREYWDKLYAKAKELFGSEPANIPTITRPWIVPGEIILREAEGAVYIFKASLKVMLEEDYLTSPQSTVHSPQYSFKDSRMKELNVYSSQLIRELILPKLTQEVNSGKNYAQLRQVYFSLVLSRWFKMRFKGLSPKGTVPFLKLIDSGDLTNLTSKQPWSKTTYFKEYQKSFNQGEYNLKEEITTPTGQVIRSYVSGGTYFEDGVMNAVTVTFSSLPLAEIPFPLLSQDNLFISFVIISGVATVITVVSTYIAFRTMRFKARNELVKNLLSNGLDYNWLNRLVEELKKGPEESHIIYRGEAKEAKGKFLHYIPLDLKGMVSAEMVIIVEQSEGTNTISFQIVEEAGGSEEDFDVLKYFPDGKIEVLPKFFQLPSFLREKLVEIFDGQARFFKVPPSNSSPLTQVKELKKQLQSTISQGIDDLTKLDVRMRNKLHTIIVKNMGKYAEVDNPDDINSLLVATIKKIGEWADEIEQEIKPGRDIFNKQVMRKGNALTYYLRPLIEKLTKLRLSFVSIFELPSIPVGERPEGNMPTGLDDGGYGERVPYSMDEEGSGGTADSALTKKAGGIDWTDLEKYMRFEGFKGKVDLSLPMLSKAELEHFDLSREQQALDRLLAIQITRRGPADDRLLRYLGAVFQKGEFSQRQLELLRFSQQLCNFLDAKGLETSPAQQAFIIIAATGLYTIRQGGLSPHYSPN